MEKITVNGKDYKLKKIDFNAMCELGDLGLDLTNITSKSMSAVRSLFAFHSGLDVEKAGAEIMAHMQNGGDFVALTEELFNSLTSSDFFQALPTSNDAEEIQ